jgi:DNA-binding transcriptional regulator GbsR (MarR family)
MNKTTLTGTEKAKCHLVDASGRVSQDLGLGRIIGQVMASLYFREEPSSLDDIVKDLNLSKAAVSIATRQLDKIGLIKEVWIKGDRKTYYKTSDHLAATLQKGFLELLRGKLRTTDEILKEAEMCLQNEEVTAEKKFLDRQIDRARKIHQKVDNIINNPLFKLISG